MVERVAIQRVEPLREQVADAILALLQAGELLPGTRITEQGLAKQLNVSRTPVREALGRLAQRGIVENRAGGGYLVPLPSTQEIKDIIAVRLLLEPPAIRMAAEQFTDQNVRALDAAIEAERNALSEKNTVGFAQGNEAFRQALFAPISNKILYDVISQFNAHLQFIRASTLKHIDLRKQIIARQDALRDAIKQGDQDLAEALWKSYLRFTEDSLLSTLGDWQTEAGEL